jgi:hypothetical protein
VKLLVLAEHRLKAELRTKKQPPAVSGRRSAVAFAPIRDAKTSGYGWGTSVAGRGAGAASAAPVGWDSSSCTRPPALTWT